MKSNCITLILLALSIELIYAKRKDSDKRIVNGNIGRPGLYPFMVNIWKGSTFLCGGTILSERWVLTSAHCLRETTNDHSQLKLFAGSILLGGGTQYAVSRGVMHSLYTPTRNDIGMLKIKTKFVFNANIRPIKVNTVGLRSDANYVDCVVPGWGREVKNGKLTLPSDRKIRIVAVSIIDHSSCFEIKQAIDPTTQICATGNQFGSGVCVGDSGGPLVCNNIQVAIVSYGRPDCGSATWHKMGTVFMRAASYFDWITKTANS